MVEPERPAVSATPAPPKVALASRDLLDAASPLGFPVLGIGCSAGGLQALDRFFAVKPITLGMAIVVVQHLSPSQPSALPELLGRMTGLTVTEAVDGVAVEVDHVYVIAPNKDLTIVGGALRLTEVAPHVGPRLAVDRFLRSLAADQGEGAVAIILSGMGSDGLLGAGAVRGRGGLVLAQDPSSAGSDSMPRAVIDAGFANIVAAPEQMLERIVDYLGHPTIAGAPAAASPQVSSSFIKILDLLRHRRAVDFSLYKTTTLMRRIERRVALHRLGGLQSYAQYLHDNPQEVDLLFRELLIGVTQFFRDPQVWETLRDEAIPALIGTAAASQRLRAWVPACSSGEEAYSLAMVFSEAMAKAPSGPRAEMQIYATDLDPDAIEIARKGVYPRNVMVDISPERIARFFVEEPEGFRVRKEIREMVVFATQNIIADPPFTRLDILCCRNLLIYFRGELQARLMPIFHYALRRGGMLLLGSAESVGAFDRLFAPLDVKSRLFMRLDHPASLSGVDFAADAAQANAVETPRTATPESLEALADRVIQQKFAPPAVLVNGDGDILYVSGRTGKYLEPSAGRFNINIHAMLRQGLREAVPGAIRRAMEEGVPIRLERLQVAQDAEAQLVNVTVQPLDKPEALSGSVLIVFNDVVRPAKGRRASKVVPIDLHENLHRELQQVRESQQVAYEEMQASMEELRSSNEELQSANEELTASKEEMQSLNEELQTVNAELRAKVDELTNIRNDMANLLNSTEIATIFLDVKMRLRRYTPHAVGLFQLIPGDVGRPLSDLSSELDYPELRSDAEEVLRTLIFREREIGARDGRWYRARIMPYRTLDNVIDGVVMTFIDISQNRKLQDQLSQIKRS